MLCDLHRSDRTRNPAGRHDCEFGLWTPFYYMQWNGVRPVAWTRYFASAGCLRQSILTDAEEFAKDAQKRGIRLNFSLVMHQWPCPAGHWFGSVMHQK
jgi:hypothetical protein